jgi:predicted DNA-binding transcriptional regulator YafY
MARSEKQKQKLLRLLELFYQRTDEEHGVTVNEIIAYLDSFGISAERKSVYDDIASLSDMGYEIDKLNTKPPRYYLVNRAFELAELKLLVDAVQSAKFITEKKSRELIGKLEGFAGKYGAGALSRQVYVEGRAKTMNKATLYTIDTIHSAINNNESLSFKYFDYDCKGERALRHGGERYNVSPVALILSDGNYYLVAFDNFNRERKHYRVDKMLDAAATGEARIVEAAEGLNSADYSMKVFGMYGGEETAVTLWCDESLSGVIIDRFGASQRFMSAEGGFKVSVKVMPSPNFYAWVLGFGSRMAILSPQSVKDGFKEILTKTLEKYNA